MIRSYHRRVWRLGLSLTLAGCEVLFPRASEPPTDAIATDADDGGAPRGSCSSLTMIGESFDTSIAPHWEARGQGSHVLDAQTLRLNVLGGSQTYELVSRHYYDLTDTELAVDVTSDGNGEIGFSLFQVETGDELQIRIANGFAIGEKRLAAGGVLARGMQPITGTTTRLIIRNTATSTEWLVVDSGQPHLLESEPKETTFVRPRLFAFGTTANNATGTFDNLNSGGPIGQACPIADLADPFLMRPPTEPPFGLAWAPSAMDTCDVVFDGRLVVDMDTLSGVCDLLSSTVYDLTTGPIAAEISTMGEARLRFGFPLDNDRQVEFDYDGTDLVAIINGGATTLIERTPYNRAAHHWLRFRYDAGNTRLLWETSSDGAQWTELGRTSLDLVLSRITATAVRFELVGPPTGSTTRFVVDGLEAR